MKLSFRGLMLFTAFFISITTVSAQDWKKVKDKDGIRIYQAEASNSSYKNIKVECTIDGTFDKLMAILNDVSKHKEWVYNNKTSSVLKRISPVEFYYYTETTLPWPMSNRDAVIHLKMTKDSLNRFLNITAVADADYIPEKENKVRVPSSNINWHVTMPTSSTINIVYTFEADPGGSVPAWLVNSFADKGPYESFRKLAALLRK
jgi:hypothetical protein